MMGELYRVIRSGRYMVVSGLDLQLSDVIVDVWVPHDEILKNERGELTYRLWYTSLKTGGPVSEK